MKTVLFGLIIWLLPLFSYCQSLQKLLDNGEKVTLTILPIGDRFTDPSWSHSYQIIKSDSTYIVVLIHDNETFKKTISKSDLKPFIKYVKKWRSKKPKYFGLSQDGIILKIGNITETFNASFKSDVKLLDIMYKYKQTNPIKMGH